MSDKCKRCGGKGWVEVPCPGNGCCSIKAAVTGSTLADGVPGPLKHVDDCPECKPTPEELKPCPFCGKKPVMFEGLENKEFISLGCRNSFCHFQPKVRLTTLSLDGEKDAELRVFEYWNRRAEQPKPPMTATGAVDKEKLLAGLENLYAISGDDSQGGIGEVIDLVETGKFDLPSVVPADLTKEEKP